jgi:hypothetical protein
MCVSTEGFHAAVKLVHTGLRCVELHAGQDTAIPCLFETQIYSVETDDSLSNGLKFDANTTQPQMAKSPGKRLL